MTQKHLIFTIGLFILSIGAIKAQDSLPINLDSVYSRVDVLPEFPGGMKALGKYVDGKNHYYPEQARKNKIEGKVIIQFSDFKVIKGIGYGCDEAAVEAFKKMPKWKPATINGQPVKFLTQMAYLYGL
jgi:hypothetical protein